MYNLLIAVGVATGLFALGWVVAGTWIAGFVPALLALVITYFLLARRTGRLLEALMNQAAAEFQQGRIERGRKVLEQGFGLGKWQFLVEGQIHAQLGSLDYLQRNFKDARKRLGKAWSRNWMAHAMLAAIDAREKKYPDALERLDKITGPGGKDPTFWGLYAWVALESGDREKALSILADGLKKNENSEALKGMANSVRNKRKVKMKGFAPAWYQFFPEHMPRKQMMANTQQRPGYSYPTPRR